MLSAKRQLGVFAKYWRSGEVKTRLARSIEQQTASVATGLCAEHISQSSYQRAAAIYKQMLFYLLDRLRQVEANRVVGFWPPSAKQEMADSIPKEWSLWEQPDGDLGQRMSDYFRDAFHQGLDAAILVGSDCPQISAAEIGEVYSRLKNVDIVLGPAMDGGYYLIGMSRYLPEVFDEIPWSTPQVWSETLNRIERNKFSSDIVDLKYDIDDCNDLTTLLEDLSDNNDVEARTLRGELLNVLKRP